MKKAILFIGVFLGCLAFAHAQQMERAKKVYPLNWHMLSYGGKDSLYGAEVNKAYDFLKGKQPRKKVVVAIIDSGFDDQHEDLKDNLWVNRGEVPGDGVDNDANGYADDIHGWNFLGTKDGKMIIKVSKAGDRFFMAHKARYEELKAKSRSEEEQQEFTNLEETFKKGDFGQAYLGMDIGAKIREYIERIDQDLTSKFPDQELTRDKFLTLIDRAEKDTMRITAFYICYFRWQDTTLRWEDVYKQRFDTERSAERTYEELVKSYQDERELVGDKIENNRDRSYGNPILLATDSEHGTHVAGIVGAVRGNGIGTDGIADNVELMLIRAVPKGDEYDKDIASAIRYAVDNGADIINMSFGKLVSEHVDWVMDAMRYAERKGVLLVHAAGNDYRNTDQCNFFPVKKLDGGDELTNFISVGASTPEGEPARMSNYGKESVDVFAPGVEIYSTIPGDNYVRKGGTSMAAPVVSGIAAMVMSYYPELSARQVKDILVRGAVVGEGKKVQVPQDPYLGNIPTKALFSDLCVSGGIISAYEVMKLAEQSLSKFQREFIAGKRTPKFLKEYLEEIKKNPGAGDLGEVLDCYLMTFPLNERYGDERWQDFMEYIPGMNARSLLELVENWNKVDLTREQGDALVTKVQANCFKAFSDHYFMKNRKSPKPDYSLLLAALEKSEFPLPKADFVLLKMWELNKKHDIQGMMNEMMPVMAELAALTTIPEIAMRDTLLSDLLEATTLEQCKMVEALLNNLTGKKSEKSTGSLEGMRSNFEGRSLLLEWEQNNLNGK